MRLFARLALVALLPALAASAQQQEYEIGPGDVLKVAVFGQADMTGDFAVDAEGIMAFPFVGKIKASGLSTDELERKLITLLSDGYLRRPRVSVSVKEYRSLRVFVTGEVVKPGPYGLRPERSLLALMGDVGELTKDAGHEVIVVRPPKPEPTPTPGAEPEPTPGESPEPNGKPTPTPKPTPEPKLLGLPGEVPGAEILRVSLRELRSGNPDKDLRLEPGDTIYFPKAAQFYVTGNVARPGVFRFEEGLTVFQALNVAGGITERGSSGGVRIVRIVDGKRKELKCRPTDVVLPEDTIVVPERFF